MLYMSLFFNSRAYLLYNIWVFLELFLYPSRKFCSLFWLYFNSTLELLGLTAYSILGCYFSKFFSSTSSQSFFSESKSVSFVLLFHNQVSANSFSLLFVFLVLSRLLSELSYIKLRRELASNLFFLKISTEAAFASFYCTCWGLNEIIIRLE